MNNDIQSAYDELSNSFSKLTLEEKRQAIAAKIIEMSKLMDQIKQVSDIQIPNAIFSSEEEYLCYLNGLIYNFENKIGNIFDSIL